MKISSLYYTHKPGGFCKRLYKLLNALSDSGHQVTYYCLDRPPDTLSPKIKWRKIPFLSKKRSGLFFWIIFSLWAPLYLIFADSSRWVVFSPYYSLLLGLNKILSGSNLICFIRSKLSANYDYPLANSLDTFFSKASFKLSDLIILQTAANQSLAIKLGCCPLKTKVLSNNIELLDFKEAKHSKPLRLITAGVFNKNKNLSVLIECWKILEEKGFMPEPIPVLTVIGSTKESFSFSAAPHLKNIIIKSWQENLAEELIKHHIYLHPSLHEGMPNAVLEAMGLGIPVILADTEELRELAGSETILFKSVDAIDLAQKIRTLSINSDQYGSLVEICRQRAKELNFNWGKHAVNLSLS